MKIVDRKTFLQMPKGTVYCKFPLKFERHGADYCLGIGAPSILLDSYSVDFLPLHLGDDLWPIDAHNSESLVDILMDMQSHLGKEVPFEHCSGRDGLCEDESVGFAIFSRDEVQEMIDLLQQALKDGYDINPQS